MSSITITTVDQQHASKQKKQETSNQPMISSREGHGERKKNRQSRRKIKK
jgi:hypothetical protein